MLITCAIIRTVAFLARVLAVVICFIKSIYAYFLNLLVCYLHRLCFVMYVV
jgi:hypothetical protein